MAMQQLSLPGEIVKKDNRLVRAKINISSVDASRILANLVACIRVSDNGMELSKQVYEVSAKDFLNLPGGGNYTRIKAICRDLSQANAEIEHDKAFTIRPFFSVIAYDTGIIRCIFNPAMHDLLSDLRKCFTQYNLIEYLKLPSIYSQRLFEILKSWNDKPEVIISMTDLHRMLNTPQSLKNDFAQFRRRILEKAHNDITEKTSFQFEWDPVKIGRSVERIRFLFAGNRRALAEKVKEDARKEKQSRLNNSRFIRAVQCSQAKHGDCRTQDNRPIICKLCQRFDMCADARKSSKL